VRHSLRCIAGQRAPTLENSFFLCLIYENRECKSSERTPRLFLSICQHEIIAKFFCCEVLFKVTFSLKSRRSFFNSLILQKHDYFKACHNSLLLLLILLTKCATNGLLGTSLKYKESMKDLQLCSRVVG